MTRPTLDPQHQRPRGRSFVASLDKVRDPPEQWRVQFTTYSY
jgi:hypothetical protein